MGVPRRVTKYICCHILKMPSMEICAAKMQRSVKKPKRSSIVDVCTPRTIESLMPALVLSIGAVLALCGNIWLVIVVFWLFEHVAPLGYLASGQK